MRSNRIGFRTGILAGGLVTAPLIGLLYLADQAAGFDFLPFSLFGRLTQILPGPLITFGLDLMIDAMRLLGLSVAANAKLAEQVMAVLFFLAGGAVAGGFLFAANRTASRRGSVLTGAIAGGILGLGLATFSWQRIPASPSPALNYAWVLSVSALAGAALGWIQHRLAAIPAAGPPESPPIEEQATAPPKAEVRQVGRREFLVWLGTGSAAITVVGSGVGLLLARRAAAGDGAGPDVQGPFPEEQAALEATQTPIPEDTNTPAPGTRPEITPLSDHYKVFIGLEATEIAEEGYRLPITGMVDKPLELSLEDIPTRYEPFDQYVTLSCISGRIPTTLIGTTLWTGVSLQEILEDAGVQPEARYLHVKSGDGFYETIDLELIKSEPRIMLCYAWDGAPLPVEHGFPLRVWIPDRFGMKQPKWITEMQVTDKDRPGYWVARGWDAVAQVKTRSVIDKVAVEAAYQHEGQTTIPVGGIAFSGARGISSVEIRVDGGAWQEARLFDPLSETTWVQWRFEWPFESGEHTFEVRCFEADGTPQIAETDSPRPSGATGIHSVEGNYQV
jgi:DMSO/TMAO reductase YedYZ molybdopterin-dependent catalytic subunit